MLTCPSCGRESPEDFGFCPACGATLSPEAPAREVRKTVTVVFCDVTGSTALGEKLDPEALRRVMTRYFEAMRAALERHGGTVEKFIGDAVMAVFGIPQVHEDDAIRAVRASADMREGLGPLNKELERDHGTTLACRIGVNTGEVVAGDPTAGQALVTGDAVNVAARLEQVAAPGEILLGAETNRMVRDAAVTEPIDPVELKGKAEPVSAHRLTSVTSGTPGRMRRMASPMVGRERELAALHQAFDRAAANSACQLFTILAPAGVGKSRLVEEFLDGIADATVLRGRCLPYGEGITYFPVLEVVKQAAGLVDFDSPELVESKICAVLDGEEHQDVVCKRIAQLMGVADVAAPEETFWAIRRMLEAVARHRALVLVFDDVHWGEATFLDLIEHVADWSRDAPILLACMARPELLDVRPAWAGGKLNATTASLEPLSEEESERLITNLLGAAEVAEELRSRIAESAEGNPLFVEEMLAMLIDDGLLARDDGRWVPTGDLSQIAVPPTITALLSARLDRLSPGEREVLERASVVGKEFFRGAVRELTPEPDRGNVDEHVRALVRKELVRPDRSTLPGEDAFRFRHLLIRDAAYDAMPKELRAELHERFAAWLERVAGERIAEQEEILGYHLEQAYRLRAELGPTDDHGRELARQAADHLASAGRRSYERGDTAAAINLFSRAVELSPEGSGDRVRLGIELGRNLAWGGQEVKAIEVLEEAGEAARALGDPALQTHASLVLVEFRAWRDPRAWAEWRPTAERAIQVFEAVGDELGLARALYLIAWDHNIRCRYAEKDRTIERALGHARAAADRSLESELLGMFAGSVWGPLPAAEGLVRCEEAIAEAGGHREFEADMMRVRAALVAMLGDLDQARRLYADGKAIIDELGRPVASAFAVQEGWYIEMLSRDFVRAEELTTAEYRRLLEADSLPLLDITRDMVALSICAQGRLEEAEAIALESEQRNFHPGDVTGQVYWRRIRGRALSARGEHEEAVRLAREAVALFEGTDALVDHGEALLDLAQVLRAAGDVGGSRAAAREALALYERKENVVEAARATAFLAELGREPDRRGEPF